MNTYSPSHFHFSHTGIYLLDMIYIDSAYPASDSIIETQQRTNQMNNILRVISDLQMSCTYGQFISSQSVRRIFSCEICREISDPRVYCIYMHTSDPRHPPHRSPCDPPACAEVLDVCSLHRGASEVRGR